MKLIADIKDIFGTITPPSPLAGYVSGNQAGAAGISKFISNGILLIYSIAAVVLVLMLLWGAFEWLVSGGDKEAVAKARTRIINAFIGIILFAVTFAILALLGQFTGFTFFVGQNNKPVPMNCESACGTTDPAACTICSNGTVLCYQSASNCPK